MLRGCHRPTSNSSPRAAVVRVAAALVSASPALASPTTDEEARTLTP